MKLEMSADFLVCVFLLFLQCKISFTLIRLMQLFLLVKQVCLFVCLCSKVLCASACDNRPSGCSLQKLIKEDLRYLTFCGLANANEVLYLTVLYHVVKMFV
jgi:hypothetical protein